MIVFIQIVLVVVILSGMVMLLLSLNHLFGGSFNSDRELERRLRDEVKERSEVIGEESVFSVLVSERSRRGSAEEEYEVNKSGHAVSEPNVNRR